MQLTKNAVAALFAIGLGGCYLLGAFLMPEAKGGHQVGPHVFPYLVGIATVLCGVALLFHERKAQQQQPFSFHFIRDKDVWLKILALSVLGCLYGEFLETLGYVIATAIFMFCCFSLINRGHHRANIAFSLIFALVTYAVFAIGLELSLPRGVLDFLPF